MKTNTQHLAQVKKANLKNIFKPGRGFSLPEIKEAKNAIFSTPEAIKKIKKFDSLGLKIDTRRKSKHSQNIEVLIKILNGDIDFSSTKTESPKKIAKKEAKRSTVKKTTLETEQVPVEKSIKDKTSKKTPKKRPTKKSSKTSSKKTTSKKSTSKS